MQSDASSLRISRINHDSMGIDCKMAALVSGSSVLPGCCQPIPWRCLRLLGLRRCRTPFTRRGALAGALGTKKGRGAQEVERLWHKYFSDPSAWWDNRLSKPNQKHADFCHKKTQQRLWLNDKHKPLWVDSQLDDVHGKQGIGLVELKGCMRGSEDVLEVHALCKDGRLDKALEFLLSMDEKGRVPSVQLYVDLLQACEDRQGLAEAKMVHSHLAKHGLELNKYLGERVITTLIKCGGLQCALQVFQRFPHRSAFCWTSVISGYSEAGDGQEALRLYQQMQAEGVQPSKYTFLSLINACTRVADQEQGKRIHSEVEKHRCQFDPYVGAALVNMYAHCGSVADARHVFDALPNRDLVLWNTMIGAYAQMNEAERAFELQAQMQEAGIKGDLWTLVSLLKACTTLADVEESTFVDGRRIKLKSLEKGKALHDGALQQGYGADVFVGNSLVRMYAKCGSIAEARQVFDTLPQRDIVSWNGMVAGYAQQGEVAQCLKLYSHMQQEGLSPNEVTFLSILKACSNTGALKTCKQIHHDVLLLGLESNLSVATALIHTYSKCGSMADARDVFDSLPCPDVVAWNALIAGYAGMGDTALCIRCFQKMQKVGVEPTGVTFLVILSACSHAGKVEAGLQYFDSMISSHGIVPDAGHYAAIADLVGRAGLFQKAEDLISKMPLPPDLAFWLSLLASCRKHNNVTLARRCFDSLLQLDSRHGAAYSLMATTYAQSQMWESADGIEDLRELAGAVKKCGCSWIEHHQQLIVFEAGNVTGLRLEERKQLYHMLHSLNSQVEEISNGDLCPLNSS